MSKVALLIYIECQKVAMHAHIIYTNVEYECPIWLGSPQRLKHFPVGELQIAGVGIKPTTHVRYLGIMIDNDLSLQCHVNHITRTCFYHLRQLRVIRRSLTVASLQLILLCLHSYPVDLTTVMEFLLVCTNNSTTDFNLSARAAARFVLRLQKWPSVSEAPRNKLYWLPYPERVEFKLSSTIYKYLHNSEPQYLIELCIPVARLPRCCHMRSAAYGAKMKNEMVSFGAISFTQILQIQHIFWKSVI